MTETKSNTKKDQLKNADSPKFKSQILIGGIAGLIILIVAIVVLIIMLSSGPKEYSFSATKDLKEYVELNKGIYKAEISFIDGVSEDYIEGSSFYKPTTLQTHSVVACKIAEGDNNLFTAILVGEKVFYKYGDENKPNDTFEITEKKNYAVECISEYSKDTMSKYATKVSEDLYAVTITKQ